MRLLSLVLTLALTALAVGQEPVAPFGSLSGGGSGDPTRISVEGEPRIGNSSFALRLECAQPNSNAFLILSPRHDSVEFLGLEILPKLGSRAVVVGPIVTDDEGCAVAPLPIDPLDSLVGTRIVAQWLSAHPRTPSGFTATRALRLTVMPAEERVFVASELVFQLRDATDELDSVSIAPSDGVPGYQSVPLVVTSNGQAAILILNKRDFAVPELRWYDVGADAIVQLGSLDLDGTAAEVAVHPTTGEIYVVSGAIDLGPTTYTVRVFDGDTDSAAFMTELRSFTLAGSSYPVVRFTPSGDQLVVSSFLVLTVLDTAPGSPTPDALVIERPSGVTGLFAISPSEETLLLPRLFSNLIDEIDLETGETLSTTTLSNSFSVVASVQFASSGEAIVSRNPTSAVEVLDPDACDEGPTFTAIPTPTSFFSLAEPRVSPDADRVYSALLSSLRILDRTTGTITEIDLGLSDNPLTLRIL
ncbi:MAG: hypothetical protein AAF196_07340 [Planctomycetota bacterium]